MTSEAKGQSQCTYCGVGIPRRHCYAAGHRWCHSADIQAAIDAAVKAAVKDAQTALARIAKVSCFVDMADSDADQAKDALHGIGVLQRIARTALSPTPGASDDE